MLLRRRDKQVRGVEASQKQGHYVPLWSLALPVVFLSLLMLITGQAGDGRLHVWVLDVGQGDAIFIRTPQGHTALVDGGPGATPLLNGVGQHVPFWQRDIDLVVLTHPHDDHMMGLVDLASRYGIGQEVRTVVSATGGVQGAWLQTERQRHVLVHLARRGEAIGFDGEPDVVLRVLSPISPDAAAEKRGGDLNNTSVVVQLRYGEESILLEGDAQDAAEAEMVRREGDRLHSTVLKVGHHGSATSSSRPFLDKVRPQLAVISVGQGNKFGHPVKQTLDALASAGAKVVRTDLNGTVELIMEKDKMWVRSER